MSTCSSQRARATSSGLGEYQSCTPTQCLSLQTLVSVLYALVQFSTSGGASAWTGCIRGAWLPRRTRPRRLRLVIQPSPSIHNIAWPLFWTQGTQGFNPSVYPLSSVSISLLGSSAGESRLAGRLCHSTGSQQGVEHHWKMGRPLPFHVRH